MSFDVQAQRDHQGQGRLGNLEGLMRLYILRVATLEMSRMQIPREHLGLASCCSILEWIWNLLRQTGDKESLGESLFCGMARPRTSFI